MDIIVETMKFPMPISILIFSFLPIHSYPIQIPRARIIRKGRYVRKRKNTPAYDRFIFYHTEEQGRYTIMRDFANVITDLRWEFPYYYGSHMDIDDFFCGCETTEIRKKHEQFYINTCGIKSEVFKGTELMRKMDDLANCLPRKLNIRDRQERFDIYCDEENERKEIIIQVKQTFRAIHQEAKKDRRRLLRIQKRKQTVLVRRAERRKLKDGTIVQQY